MLCVSVAIMDEVNDAFILFYSILSLNFHKNRTDKLDLKKVANTFAQSDDNRKRVFEKFTKNNL